MRMWRALYAILAMAAWPFVRWRDRGDGERARERFGYVPANVPQQAIWVHAVSAGEVVAATPLLHALQARLPDRPVLFTTTTATGSAQVQRAFGAPVAHCYAPWDFDAAVRRFLAATRPALLVLLETELWPNTLRLLHESGAPAVLVNARLSLRSARGYRLVRPLVRDMLRQLDWIACQSDAHCARFAELGADAARIEVVGNVKFDAAAPADLGARAATMRGHFGLGDAPVWVGASTHAGEDEILLDAHARLCVEFPTLRLLLVPRHPERFDAVAALAARRGFAVARRSDARPEPGARVLIGDSMGELMTFYAMSRVAFVGGSLVEAGGHNPIEGALAGVPMLIGPHVDNFEDVVGAFRAAGVLACVRTCDALVASVRQRLLDAAFANREVDTARGVVAAHRGVTERIVERLAERLAERPAERLAGPTY